MHEWGEANQVVFEPAKESFHILDRNHPSGLSFKILSVVFDTKLAMHEAVHVFASEAGWRLRTLMRTQRFHETAAMIRLYKSHILCYIEGATPALFHAAPSVLRPIDAIQETFLGQLGLSEECALLDYGLAPLSLRRDIAMLGLLFKVSSGIAPAPIAKMFRPHTGSLTAYGFTANAQFHSKAIHDPVESGHPVIIKRSIFGLIRVFNRLPQECVNAKTTSQFQHWLQSCAKNAAKHGKPNWQLMFSVG